MANRCAFSFTRFALLAAAATALLLCCRTGPAMAQQRAAVGFGDVGCGKPSSGIDQFCKCFAGFISNESNAVDKCVSFYNVCSKSDNDDTGGCRKGCQFFAPNALDDCLTNGCGL